MRKRWVVIGLFLSCVGCRAPRGEVSIHSEDPDLKIHAIQQDVCNNQMRDVATMVTDLQSDDPAIRFYSIEGLKRLTRDDFGYCYYQSDEQRAPATALWQKWLKQQSK